MRIDTGGGKTAQTHACAEIGRGLTRREEEEPGRGDLEQREDRVDVIVGEHGTAEIAAQRPVGHPNAQSEIGVTDAALLDEGGQGGAEGFLGGHGSGQGWSVGHAKSLSMDAPYPEFLEANDVVATANSNDHPQFEAKPGIGTRTLGLSYARYWVASVFQGQEMNESPYGYFEGMRKVVQVVVAVAKERVDVGYGSTCGCVARDLEVVAQVLGVKAGEILDMGNEAMANRVSDSFATIPMNDGAVLGRVGRDTTAPAPRGLEVGTGEGNAGDRVGGGSPGDADLGTQEGSSSVVDDLHRLRVAGRCGGKAGPDNRGPHHDLGAGHGGVGHWSASYVVQGAQPPQGVSDCVSGVGLGCKPQCIKGAVYLVRFCFGLGIVLFLECVGLHTPNATCLRYVAPGVPGRLCFDSRSVGRREHSVGQVIGQASQGIADGLGQGEAMGSRGDGHTRSMESISPLSSTFGNKPSALPPSRWLPPETPRQGLGGAP